MVYIFSDLSYPLGFNAANFDWPAVNINVAQFVNYFVGLLHNRMLVMESH